MPSFRRAMPPAPMPNGPISHGILSRAFALALAAAPLVPAGALLAAAPAAHAQPAPDRIYGSIVSFHDTALIVRDKSGNDVRITLPPELKIGAVSERTLADIKQGEFVGSAAVLGSDGKLHAQEVHIFPDAMRGTGEGHRPMSGANQSMTNATVSVASLAPGGDSAGGKELKLSYRGGEQVIEVDPGVRVVQLIPGDRSLLKPGSDVFVFAIRAPDGSLTARAVQAEKDGVKPLSF